METIDVNIKFAEGSEKELVDTLIQCFNKNLGDEVVKLNGIIFVDLTAVRHSREWLQDCHGVDVANELLRANPMQKIVLLETIPIEAARNIRPEIDLLLSKSNVRIWDIASEIKDLPKLFEVGNQFEIASESLPDLANREMQKVIGTVFHDLEKSKDIFNPADEHEKRMVASGIKKTKEYFPSMQDKTDKDVIDFLLLVKQEREEVMKGQNIAGVYCDIDGTLFIKGNLNERVLELLQRYEGEGKNITLWTDGDLRETQELLNRNNVTFPLKSKYDFAGATTEVVIDNDDENTFFSKTRIYPKIFIKI